MEVQQRYVKEDVVHDKIHSFQEEMLRVEG